MSRWCKVLLGAASLIALAIAGCVSSAGWGLSPAMVVSVSSDGRYAVSSHAENELVLWDIEQRTHHQLADDANIYSAYFIKGRDAVLWQDLSNTVHVETVNAQPLLEFKHAPTYGHVIDRELRYYVASDEDWRLTVGYGTHQRPIKDDGVSPSFRGSGKLLNLTITAQAGVLLSAGNALRGFDSVPIEDESPIEPKAVFSDYAGVVLWDLNTRQPLHKFSGNAAKTYATLSPDGHYAVSVGENSKGFVWHTTTGNKAYRLSSLGSGVWTNGRFDISGSHLSYPEDFPSEFDAGLHGSWLSARFVDDDWFIAVATYEPYALLYRLGDPFARAFLPLGRDPFPAVSDYDRNAAIDSAPAANLLVTGQQSSGGINVYRFDPESQTLERIWAPTP